MGVHVAGYWPMHGNTLLSVPEAGLKFACLHHTSCTCLPLSVILYTKSFKGSFYDLLGHVHWLCGMPSQDLTEVLKHSLLEVARQERLPHYAKVGKYSKQSTGYL